MIEQRKHEDKKQEEICYSSSEDQRINKNVVCISSTKFILSLLTAMFLGALFSETATKYEINMFGIIYIATGWLVVLTTAIVMTLAPLIFLCMEYNSHILKKAQLPNAQIII